MSTYVSDREFLKIVDAKTGTILNRNLERKDVKRIIIQSYEIYLIDKCKTKDVHKELCYGVCKQIFIPDFMRRV